MKDRLQKMLSGDDVYSTDLNRLSVGGAARRSHMNKTGRLVRNNNLNKKYNIIDKIMKRINKRLELRNS